MKPITNVLDFINVIRPEHDRSSCDDNNIDYNAWMEEYREYNCHPFRCKRCALLGIMQDGENRISVDEAMEYL